MLWFSCKHSQDIPAEIFCSNLFILHISLLSSYFLLLIFLSFILYVCNISSRFRDLQVLNSARLYHGRSQVCHLTWRYNYKIILLFWLYHLFKLRLSENSFKNRVLSLWYRSNETLTKTDKDKATEAALAFT